MIATRVQTSEQPIAPAAGPSIVPAVRGRVVTDGKFFRLDGKKFLVKGVAYGPFAADAEGHAYPPREGIARDLALLHSLGANVVRLYTVPPVWLLDEAIEHDLRLLIDVDWHHQACFLGSEIRERQARIAVRRAAEECAHHPATFAISLANEIPPDVVRWSGPRAVEEFLAELVGIVKEVNPDVLVTFGNFPPTEFLRPREMDFLSFNVYLHRRPVFENYLSRLQMLADTRPLLLSECGLDSIREGEARQATTLAWQIEAAFQGGLAGVVVYSFTDEWYQGGRLVTDWAFGLTTGRRAPKPAFTSVREAFAAPLTRGSLPRTSVVVASYNGARTLPVCLDALQRLHYPDYEIILVDDGSTDGTPDLAREFPQVRFFRFETNRGLSAARNRGIELATGEIVAFTDADCRPDEDWLTHLVHDLLRGGFTGIGGHNLLPGDDSPLAAVVMASPGGPTHVMLTDRQAEHLPGCNMAFWRSALIEVGGFDPCFRRAGDDVDLCWRLQSQGCLLGFSPGGFVWHYRRSRVGDYLRQQHGYGEAEAWLERKHPQNFNRFGGSRWRGRIYGGQFAGPVVRRPRIYHGTFGTGLFQTLYTGSPTWLPTLVTSLEYYVLVLLPLATLTTLSHWLLPVAILAAGLPVTVSLLAACQVEIPRRMRRLWSRPLVAMLYLLQPVVRGWARYQGRLFLRQTPLRVRRNFRAVSEAARPVSAAALAFQVQPGMHRLLFLERLLRKLRTEGWQFRQDGGWSPYDVEIYGSRWSKLLLTTASEYQADGGQVLRCQLRDARTLPARLVFWLFVAVAFWFLGWNEEADAYRLALFLLPLSFLGWLHQDARRLRAQVGVLLRRVAEDSGMCEGGYWD